MCTCVYGLVRVIAEEGWSVSCVCDGDIYGPIESAPVRRRREDEKKPDRRKKSGPPAPPPSPSLPPDAVSNERGTGFRVRSPESCVCSALFLRLQFELKKAVDTRTIGCAVAAAARILSVTPLSFHLLSQTLLPLSLSLSLSFIRGSSAFPSSVGQTTPISTATLITITMTTTRKRLAGRTRRRDDSGEERGSFSPSFFESWYAR